MPSGRRSSARHLTSGTRASSFPATALPLPLARTRGPAHAHSCSLSHAPIMASRSHLILPSRRLMHLDLAPCFRPRTCSIPPTSLSSRPSQRPARLATLRPPV
ncbi:hypothetical protein C8Q78DRAFT_218149 [Trametes maxima]|nr:hypothetical protein C8Q78DRAFT_218149 [Trametes maxima]